MTRPSLAFYGDDFTGSADVLMQCTRLGMRGSLLLGVPEPERLREAAEDHDVVGIAGVTRSYPPQRSAPIIEAVLSRLREVRPVIAQYKVCSTADSSPTLGSFGPAIESGRRLFGNRAVPVLVAQPNLGRYTAFSNHFAVDQGEIFRLDRQQIMANHPATPMREADLRLHILDQLPAGATAAALHLTDLRRAGGADDTFARAEERGATIIVIDAVDDDDLERGGELLVGLAGDSTLFAVGSGGLSIGVGRALGFRAGGPAVPTAPAQGPCLAVSGSCSRLSRDQLRYALDTGWHGIALDVSSLARGEADVLEAVLDEMLVELKSGRSVIVYTCGPDQQLAETRIDPAVLAPAFARMITRARAEGLIERALIAGGDTSGRVVEALGAVSMTAESVIGDYQTVLFRLEAPGTSNDGLEVALKGGQIGRVDFFEAARRGSAAGKAS